MPKWTKSCVHPFQLREIRARVIIDANGKMGYRIPLIRK